MISSDFNHSQTIWHLNQLWKSVYKHTVDDCGDIEILIVCKQQKAAAALAHTHTYTAWIPSFLDRFKEVVIKCAIM